MEVSRELLFFFSAIGAFNGIVLSVYFIFFAKPKHISNIFLGIFLGMLSIRIGKSVFFHFNHELSFHYLQFGLTACFFVGPFLYFYVNSITRTSSNAYNTWKYHLLILVPIALIIGFLYPFNNHVDLWRPHIIKTIYIQWFLYILMSFYLIRDRIKKIFNKNEKLSSIDIWLFSILIGNILLVSSYYFTSFVNYISGALTFSFLLYILLLFVFYNKKNKSILFNSLNKYANKKIDTSEASQLIQRLKTVMSKEDALYKNSNIKSIDVAKKIGITTHQLSQLLNDNLGKNFALYINEYRIEAAKKMLKNDTNLTLEAIGYECGFNSKSTFFTTFKKLTGKTPAQFKKHQ
ncbi:AraC family transcriptional regulator [uncultured Lacinutrix sp.]|uniref:helix-turn-helix domain-containing protein n=1 Tax=uncultured Lacinutrix sp. TaxID=574032 RepID=UPI0026273004|nr:helix-turn-helix domain-containing protein [uncultured Lacinutrix sp.]